MNRGCPDVRIVKNRQPRKTVHFGTLRSGWNRCIVHTRIELDR